VKSELEPVLRDERTRRSVPSPSSTIAATTGPELLALIASATLCSVAPAATVRSSVLAPDSTWIVPPVAALNVKPRCIEEARRSTWTVCPPMPAPPTSATATLVSELSAVCFWAQVSSAQSALAALCRAESLAAIVVRPVRWAVTAAWRYVMRVVFWRSSAISWLTIALVSTPEARPERARLSAIA
jgi:hypothetical protein